ncbi:MAG: hypothetical protein AB9888_03375 [Bacteroidales bacterium]
MKRLYTVLIALVLSASYAGAQIITERCWHLDKVQFLQHKQDFWRSHMLFSTSAKSYSSVTGGLYNITELQYGFGLAEVDVPFSHHFGGISNVTGYMFGSGLALGVGIGYNQYNDGYTIPLYGDVRYFMGNQRVKFFLVGDGGFMMNFENFKDYSRVFVNPGAGLIVPLNKNLRLSFSAGLLTMWDRDLLNDSGAGYRDSYINMKLGLLFIK